jgi:dTDP-4-dehydrorhamnose reductase
MTLKILLTGRTGQIGRELNVLLPRLGEVTAPNRQQLDLFKPRELREMIRVLRPNVIVNAAAYTAVDQAESDAQAARIINADAPALMAEEAKKIGAILVHYSTDYVFDGAKCAPYTEDDPPNPQSVYGRTKLAGEQAIRDSDVRYLIFRTAWIYATQGRNFLLTILRLASEREELKVVCDQIGAPTWSRDIATATVEILSPISETEDRRDLLSELSGIYHMTAAGETSWHGFATAILQEALHKAPQGQWFQQATGRRRLIARRIIPIATADYPMPARRPAYSVLSNTRLARVFRKQLPDWQAQLRSMLIFDRTQ